MQIDAHMAFKINSIGDAPETMQSIPFMELKVLTDLPSDELTNSEVMTSATTGVSDIEKVVSSTLPLV